MAAVLALAVVATAIIIHTIITTTTRCRLPSSRTSTGWTCCPTRLPLLRTSRRLTGPSFPTTTSRRRNQRRHPLFHRSSSSLRRCRTPALPRLVQLGKATLVRHPQRPSINSNSGQVPWRWEAVVSRTTTIIGLSTILPRNVQPCAIIVQAQGGPGLLPRTSGTTIPLMPLLLRLSSYSFTVTTQTKILKREYSYFARFLALIS